MVSYLNITRSLSPAHEITDYIANAGNEWVEKMTELGRLELIEEEHRAAINAALPDGVSLVGDEFLLDPNVEGVSDAIRDAIAAMGEDALAEIVIRHDVDLDEEKQTATEMDVEPSIPSILNGVEKAIRQLNRAKGWYDLSLDTVMDDADRAWDITVSRKRRVETITVWTSPDSDANYIIRRTVNGRHVETYQVLAMDTTVHYDGDERRASRAISAIAAMHPHFGWTSSPREATENVCGVSMTMRRR